MAVREPARPEPTGFAKLIRNIGGIFNGTRVTDVKPGRVSRMEARGVSGVVVSGGTLVTRERNAKLIGDERYLTFGEILANISIVSAGVRYFLNLVAKPTWHWEPAEDNGPDKEPSDQAKMVAEKIDHMTYDMITPWYRAVRRAAMFRFYGFSVQEWTAKKRADDGLIGIADLEVRPQRTITRWDVDESGTVYGIVQTAPMTFRDIYLPRQKVVYMVDDAIDDTPEGLGVLRHLVEPSTRLRLMQDYELNGYQTDLRGIPIARAPLKELDDRVKRGEITGDAKTAALAGMDQFIRNHFRVADLGMMLDSQTYTTANEALSPSQQHKWDVSLLQGESQGFQEINASIQRLTAELARILGVEHLLLGTDTRGALSLSQDKSHNFGVIIDSALMEMAEAVRADFAGPICDMNGWDRRLLPWPKTDAVQYRDISQLSTTLKDMAMAGAPLTPDDEAVDVMRDLLGLPRPPQLDEADAIDAALVARGLPSRGQPKDELGQERGELELENLRNEGQGEED